MEVPSPMKHWYISKFFRKYHETTYGFINELRLNYCADSLLYSDENILDIALEAGFNNISHFYHLFKKNIVFRLFNIRIKATGILWL